MSKILALIFDFDGLILNTERAVYLSWLELYQSYGHDLPLSQWVTTVGSADADAAFSPGGNLEKLVADLNWESAAARRLARESELIAQEDALPGVRQVLQDGKRLGLTIALASSSGKPWVTSHLARLGLLQYFDCIHTREEVEQTKPDPALFLHALDCLGVQPDQAVVFEDSPNGIRAAQAAGIFTVGVPTEITKPFCDNLAGLTLDSLADMPLEEILSLAENHSAR
jgi:HAD superfamily hydrolase (TIGR01509 family)